MRRFAVPLIVCSLLLISALPWMLSNCTPQALVPDDLVLAPVLYEATVTVAQGATTVAMRQVTSDYKIIPQGTVQPLEDGLGLATPTEQTSPIEIRITSAIGELTINNTGTPHPDIGETPTSGTNLLPPTPMGMIDVEDVITAEILTERLITDAQGSNLTDLFVSLSPEGIRVDGKLVILANITQSIVGYGTLEVEDYSLTVKITSIHIGETNVTEQYYQQLESRLETSLYYLLPQRYVQSFQLADGEVVVYSKVRP